MELQSNRQAYLDSRYMVEQYVNDPPVDFAREPKWWQERVVTTFASRYNLRRGWMSPDGTRVADPLGHKAVAARNLALTPASPPPDFREILDPSIVMDPHLRDLALAAGVPTERLEYAGTDGTIRKHGPPNPFCPGFYYLWAEAEQQGNDSKGCFRFIADWTWHRPACWDRDDDHREGPTRPPKTENFPHLWYKEAGVWIDPILDSYFERPVVWLDSGDLNLPWVAVVGGATWAVRINDFPDEYMYTLLVNGQFTGDFLEWPEAWLRGKAAKKTVERKPKIKAAELPALYTNGKREEVWKELIALGPKVRKDDVYPYAMAVASETMKRARHNIEVLIPRLREMGYQFHPAGQPTLDPWLLDGNDDPVLLERLQASKRFPMSLIAWLTEVGLVTLTGSHPRLAFLENEPNFPKIYSDPLDVSICHPVALEAELQTWVRKSGERGSFETSISIDTYSKAWVTTDEYPSGDFYSLELPNPAADFQVLGVKGKPYFVDYLRQAFKWGGFPGWSNYKQPPEEELRFLTNGLLDI
jgi:hypothetical protein